MRRALALASLVFFSLPALATPFYLQFTGTMFAYDSYDDAGVRTDLLGTISDHTVTGTFSIDLSLAPPPVTSDQGSAGGTYLLGAVGGVFTEFISATASWEGGSFVPSAIPIPPGMSELGDSYALYNLVGSPDRLILTDQFGWRADAFDVGLSRIGMLLSDDFLNNAVSVPTGNELPNFDTVTGQVLIQSVLSRESGPYGGFQIGVDIESLVLTQRSVPEPGTFALLACGLVAIAFARRRRGGWVGTRSVPVC